VARESSADAGESGPGAVVFGPEAALYSHEAAAISLLTHSVVWVRAGRAVAGLAPRVLRSFSCPLRPWRRQAAVRPVGGGTVRRQRGKQGQAEPV